MLLQNKASESLSKSWTTYSITMFTNVLLSAHYLLGHAWALRSVEKAALKITFFPILLVGGWLLSPTSQELRRSSFG